MQPRTRTTLTLALTALATIGCALGSPFALVAAGRWWQTDWAKLANIGQAYGAASAVFSALAVAGVGGSIVYQARQLRLARMQSVRTAHRDLTKQIIAEPEVFARAVGFDVLNRPGVDIRQHLFITNYMNYLASAVDTGVVSEQSLRSDALRYMFQSLQVHKWWEVAAPDWTNGGHELDRRFGAILQAEYEWSKLEGYPLPERSVDAAAATRSGEVETGRSSRRRLVAVAAIVAVSATAVGIGWLVRASATAPRSRSC